MGIQLEDGTLVQSHLGKAGGEQQVQQSEGLEGLCLLPFAFFGRTIPTHTCNIMGQLVMHKVHDASHALAFLVSNRGKGLSALCWLLVLVAVPNPTQQSQPGLSWRFQGEALEPDVNPELQLLISGFCLAVCGWLAPCRPQIRLHASSFLRGR